MKPALLIIDVQKDFYQISPATAQSLTQAIEYINAAITLFRRKGLPIVCIQHMNPNDNLVPGASGFDLPEDLDILPSDVRIHKCYGNAFNKTPLLEQLREQGSIPSSSQVFAPNIVCCLPIVGPKTWI